MQILQDTMPSKLNHFEGLRGICCTIVVIDHCFNMFASWARYNGPDNPLWQRLIANTPLNLIYSGIPSVYIFFLMSAFVLSLGYFKYGTSYLPSASLRRYPRLVLPCIGAGIFYVFCILLMQLLDSDTKDINILKPIWEAAYLAPLKGKVAFNDPLWTISWEIYGSFLIFAMLALFGSVRYFGWLCVAAIAWYLKTNYLPFIIGMWMCWIIAGNNSISLPKLPPIAFNTLAIAALIIAFFLMSYPYQREGIVIPKHLELISWSGDWKKDYRNNIMAGAIIVFIVTCLWQPVQKFLGHKSLVYLGKISFSAYLLHSPIIMVTSAIMPHSDNGNIEMALLKMSVVLLITLVCSIFFEKYIDQASVKISSRFSKWALNSKDELSRSGETTTRQNSTAHELSKASDAKA